MPSPAACGPRRPGWPGSKARPGPGERRAAGPPQGPALLAEVRVVDQPEPVAERIEQGHHLDAVAHVLDVGRLLGPRRQEVPARRLDVLDAPVDVHAAIVALRAGVRQQAELEAADREPDVERLIEIWLDAQRLCIPVAALRD